MKNAFDANPHLENLLLDQFFAGAPNRYRASWRKALISAIGLGIPTPAFSTALAFYDGYRTARMPANLLRAQRDYFGAHTYERVDQLRGQLLHTNWTGHGGTVGRLGLGKISGCGAPIGTPIADRAGHRDLSLHSST